MALAAISTVSAQDAMTEVSAEELSENLIEYDYNELNVAGITPTTGNFFNSIWSNVTSDVDVRMLIHGYNLVDWNGEEGLFMLDDSVVSGLVVTDDQAGNRTYTFALYSDLLYSDGSKITAWDYAFSTLLTMSKEAEVLGANVKRPEYLLGYNDYINGSASYLAGFHVVDTDMLAITVSADYLPFFYEIGLLDCSPYPISVIAPGCEVADDGDGIYMKGPFTSELLRGTILDPNTGYMTHPTVTSGPYKLVSYSGGVATFEINPYFKGDAFGNIPTIQRLTYQSINSSDLIEAYETGRIGLLNKITMSDLIQSGMDSVSNNPKQLISSNYPRTGLAFLSFAAERPLVSDVNVRQAIAYNLDKDTFIEETVGNYGLRVDGFYGLGQWMYQLLTGALAYPVDPPEPGDEKTMEEYEKELEELEEMSIEDIPVYEYNPEAAESLLARAGWTLNAQGNAYGAGDTLRYKSMNGELVPLRLSLAYPEATAAAAAIEEMAASMSGIGMEVNATALPLAALLNQYYGLEERTYDLYFLASNFDVLFDPSTYFEMNESGVPVWKNTGLADRELYYDAVAMRHTESGEILTYVKHWMEFQTRFSEVLPMIPLYSNVYFDFYPRVLHNYNITTNVSWANAIVGSYMDDVEFLEDEEVLEGDLLEEGIVVIDG